MAPWLRNAGLYLRGAYEAFIFEPNQVLFSKSSKSKFSVRTCRTPGQRSETIRSGSARDCARGPVFSEILDDSYGSYVDGSEWTRLGLKIKSDTKGYKFLSAG